MAILANILYAALFCPQSTHSEVTLLPQEVSGSVTVGYKGIIMGRPAVVAIILALNDNYIHQDFADELSISGKEISTSISFAENQVREISCKVETGNWQGVILGRSFFKNCVLRWNTSDNVIKVSSSIVSRDGGFLINTASGFFEVLKDQIPLPSISNNTIVPSSEPVKGAFKLVRVEEELDSAPPGVPVIGIINGQFQTISGINSEFGRNSIFGTKFQQGFPGASYFGAQTVEIDFRNSKIFFDPNPVHRGAFILGYRLGLDLKVQEGRLVLIGTRVASLRERFRSMGIFGFHVESFGNVKLEVSQLGDINKIREFLLAIEKEKFMRLSDGEKTFTLRFE